MLISSYCNDTGHDTTASGMSWILYALASHPEYQQTAREEVDGILDGREDQNIEWLVKMLVLCTLFNI